MLLPATLPSNALATNAQVYSWGWNERGTLGHGHRAHEHKPRRVHALSNIVQASGRVWGRTRWAARAGPWESRVLRRRCMALAAARRWT